MLKQILFCCAMALLSSCAVISQETTQLTAQATFLGRFETETMTIISNGGCNPSINGNHVRYYCNQAGTSAWYNFTQAGQHSINLIGASSNSTSAGMSVYVGGSKIGAVSFSGTNYSTQTISFNISAAGSKEIVFWLETDTNSNDTYLDYYNLNLESAPPPVLPNTGVFESGNYRNMFREWNPALTEANTTQLLNNYWNTLFASSDPNQSIYRSDGTNSNGAKAYILTIDTNDIRSEGMSYGMMIAVQMNKQAEFNAIWNWAKSNMQHKTGARAGYFCWQAGANGACMDNNPAPDGEEYMAMALFFAGHRWGNGSGIYNYTAEANAILNVMLHKTDMNGGVVDGVTNMFNATQKQIVFVPHNGLANFTDPSYHLPAFYDLFALWATGYTNSSGQNFQAADRTFWADAARTSRDYFSNAANATSGLTSDYANFDGSGCCGRVNFWGDSWRTAMNWAVDYAWWAKNPSTSGKANAVTLTNRIQGFFEAQGISSYGDQYQLPNNTAVNNYNSDGLVGTNATASLSSNNSRSWKFIEAFYNRPVSSGFYRYYNGLLGFISALHLSGNFKIYKPPTSTLFADFTGGANNASSQGGVFTSYNYFGGGASSSIAAGQPVKNTGAGTLSSSYSLGAGGYAGVALGVAANSSNSSLNLSAYGKIRLRLARNGGGALSIKIVGNESSIQNNGCYPVYQANPGDDSGLLVAGGLTEYTLELSKFQYRSYCSAPDRRTIAQTIGNVVRVEIEDRFLPASGSQNRTMTLGEVRFVQ